jgi:hypothetical protein
VTLEFWRLSLPVICNMSYASIELSALRIVKVANFESIMIYSSFTVFHMQTVLFSGYGQAVLSAFTLVRTIRQILRMFKGVF